MIKNINLLSEEAAAYASSKIDNSDEDWSFKFDRDYDEKFAELIIKDCVGIIIKAYRGCINPSIIIQAVKEQYNINLTKSKICSNKVDGVCSMHNLHCSYSKCEE